MPVFTANIPGLLKIGDKVEIGGKIKENARKMSVNLCAQEGEEPRDVVLHFDVRFHRDNIISLSRKNGIWIGSGNLDTNYNMFVPGTIFRIVFEVKDTDVITIYCQGKFHSNFLPKIPLTMAKYLVAWADIERITHCYFYMNEKSFEGDQDNGMPVSPRLGGALAGQDGKRGGRGPKQMSTDTNESSEEDHSSHIEAQNARSYFYDTFTCHKPENKSPQPQKFKRDKIYKDSELEEKVDSDYSEASRNIASSAAGSGETIHQMKKMRRGRLGPFSHVVNFMERSRRKI